MNNKKGQGALEYLLMIGAAILVVAIVIIAISGLIVETKDQNVSSDYENQMGDLTDFLHKGENLKNLPSINTFLVEGVSGTISGSTISVILPSSADLSSLTPTILVKGGTVSPASGVAQDFSNGAITYTVTDANGNNKVYVVTVTKNLSLESSDKNVISYEFNYWPLETNTFIEGQNKILTASMSYGTPKVLEVGVFISSTASLSTPSAVDKGFADPVEDTYPEGKWVYFKRDFSNPVEFTLTAQDGSTQKYIIRVTFLPNSSKEISYFEFSSIQSIGIIDKSNKTILVRVPSYTNVNSLTPNIVISSGATISPASQVAQDFSNPVNYTVTAEDGSTQTFSVSVVKEAGVNYTLISTCEELSGMALDGNYRLANNIDCSNLSFSPIGGGLNGYGCNSPFAGSFDGNGKIISNLTINSEDSGIGLFGCSSGNISNVGLINFNVSGFSSVGALVGLQIGGIISNSYSTGNITSSGGYSGGLVGAIRQNGIISNCYSSANVTTSFWFVGGLVGLNDGLVFDSYSTGVISGESSTGGLIGHSNSGETIESYWDKETSLQNGSVGGSGKTTLEMKNPSTFNSWDSSIWEITQGSYPKLVLFNENPI